MPGHGGHGGQCAASSSTHGHLQRGSSTAAATCCCLRVRRCLQDAWLTATPSLFSFHFIEMHICCVPLVLILQATGGHTTWVNTAGWGKNKDPCPAAGGRSPTQSVSVNLLSFPLFLVDSTKTTRTHHCKAPTCLWCSSQLQYLLRHHLVFGVAHSCKAACECNYRQRLIGMCRCAEQALVWRVLPDYRE